MDFQELMTDQLVLFNREADSKEELLRQMIAVLNETDRVSDTEAFIQTVMAREQSGATGIGFGFAIPHGKSNAVFKPSVVFASLTNGIDWNNDGQSVHYVFLIAVPEEQAGNEHIKLMSGLARKLVHEEFRSNIASASTPDDIYKALS